MFKEEEEMEPVSKAAGEEEETEAVSKSAGEEEETEAKQSSPMFVPTSGIFFQHDTREGAEEKEEKENK